MLAILRQRASKHLVQNIINLQKYFKKIPKRDIYYFGYGANLDMERFSSRNMNVEEIGNAVLEDYELKFTLSNEYKSKGYAGVHKCPGREVWGVLYKMDDLSLLLLDIMEWAKFGAYKREKLTVSYANQKIKCECYIVNKPRFDLYPPKTYLNYIIKSSLHRNFPKTYIDELKCFKSLEHFELDHTYSLWNYAETRAFASKLKAFYIVHDRLREKLCRWI